MIAECVLEMVWKEVVVAYFEMISRICLQKNEEKYRSLKYETADFWAEV
jgi:hypothetical protein